MPMPAPDTGGKLQNPPPGSRRRLSFRRHISLWPAREAEKFIKPSACLLYIDLRLDKMETDNPFQTQTTELTMATEAPAIDQADPLKSVADAMKDAVNQATEDAAKTKERLSQMGPDIANSASRFAYTTSYMLSYGVVYAAVFVAKSVPQENPIVEGFIDGGRAAIDAVNEAKGIKPA
jgi:hypothetical protein